MGYRPYQYEVIYKCLRVLTTSDSVIMSLPTGSGKTACATAVLSDFLNSYPNKKVIFLVPRLVLAYQQATEIKNWLGHSHAHEIGMVVGGMSPVTRQEVVRNDNNVLLIFRSRNHV